MLALNSAFTGAPVRGCQKKFALLMGCFTTRYEHFLLVCNLVFYYRVRYKQNVNNLPKTISNRT